MNIYLVLACLIGGLIIFVVWKLVQSIKASLDIEFSIKDFTENQVIETAGDEKEPVEEEHFNLTTASIQTPVKKIQKSKSFSSHKDFQKKVLNLIKTDFNSISLSTIRNSFKVTKEELETILKIHFKKDLNLKALATDSFSGRNFFLVIPNHGQACTLFYAYIEKNPKVEKIFERKPYALLLLRSQEGFDNWVIERFETVQELDKAIEVEISNNKPAFNLQEFVN